jgi:arsenate reductase
MTGKAPAQRVLFICTHNSARSQMAEGFLRAWGGSRFESFSAGTEATEVRPLAIEVMREHNIDISGQESKTLDCYLDQPFDWVVTVCDRAREACPYFPGARNVAHWDFDDPSAASGSVDERRAVFRRVAGEIAGRVRELITSADGPATSPG